MAVKARQYKQSTVRRLDTLSGNECTAPGCDKLLIARDGQSIISKICHIEAASADGPRYNPTMSDDDRRHFTNLILLCDECHIIIDNKDNAEKYPVECLKEWKDDHHGKYTQKLQIKQSLLKMAIDAIADQNFDEVLEDSRESSCPFKIEEKIQYNMVRRNKPLINSYKVYYNKISALYDELESQGSFKKDKLLTNIRRIYLKVKGKYIDEAENDIEVVRENADSIIEDIEDILISSDGIGRAHFPVCRGQVYDL